METLIFWLSAVSSNYLEEGIQKQLYRRQSFLLQLLAGYFYLIVLWGPMHVYVCDQLLKSLPLSLTCHLVFEDRLSS